MHTPHGISMKFQLAPGQRASSTTTSSKDERKLLAVVREMGFEQVLKSHRFQVVEPE
jgi:hypothetical protein